AQESAARPLLRPAAARVRTAAETQPDAGEPETLNFLQRGGIQRRLILITLIPAALRGVLLVTFFPHVRLDAVDQEMPTPGQLIADQLAPATEYAVLTGNLALLE